MRVGRLVDIFLIGRAAILHGLDAVEKTKAALVDTISVDRGCEHIADDHDAIDPFLYPDEFAFEMPVTFLDARRLDAFRGQCSEACLFELIDPGFEGQAEDAGLSSKVRSKVARLTTNSPVAWMFL